MTAGLAACGRGRVYAGRRACCGGRGGAGGESGGSVRDKRDERRGGGSACRRDPGVYAGLPQLSGPRRAAVRAPQRGRREAGFVQGEAAGERPGLGAGRSTSGAGPGWPAGPRRSASTMRVVPVPVSSAFACACTIGVVVRIDHDFSGYSPRGRSLDRSDSDPNLLIRRSVCERVMRAR